MGSDGTNSGNNGAVSASASASAGAASASGGANAGSGDDSEQADLCVVCLDAPRDAVLIPCGHAFTCTECIARFKKRTCPMCRAPIQKIIRARAHAPAAPALEDTRKDGGVDGLSTTATSSQSVAQAGTGAVIGRSSIVQKMGKGAFASSTKVDAVVERVQSVIKDSKTAKIIIFSQYRAMIDLVSCSRIASSCTTFC